MRAEEVNPFLEAATKVYRQVLGVELLRGRMEVRKSPAPSHDIAILVDVKGGATHGRVVFSLNIETAYKITRKLVPNVSDANLILEYRDVLGEIANMIAGNAMSTFLRRGAELDLSTPLVIDARTKKLTYEEKNTLSLYFYSPIGLLEMNVAVA